VTPT